MKLSNNNAPFVFCILTGTPPPPPHLAYHSPGTFSARSLLLLPWPRQPQRGVSPARRGRHHLSGLLTPSGGLSSLTWALLRVPRLASDCWAMKAPEVQPDPQDPLLSCRRLFGGWVWVGGAFPPSQSVWLGSAGFSSPPVSCGRVSVWSRGSGAALHGKQDRREAVVPEREQGLAPYVIPVAVSHDPRLCVCLLHCVGRLSGRFVDVLFYLARVSSLGLMTLGVASAAWTHGAGGPC